MYMRTYSSCGDQYLQTFLNDVNGTKTDVEAAMLCSPEFDLIALMPSMFPVYFGYSFEFSFFSVHYPQRLYFNHISYFEQHAIR